MVNVFHLPQYIRTPVLPVCYCGNISKLLHDTAQNEKVTRPKAKWLLYLSVIWTLGWALDIQSGQGSQTSQFEALVMQNYIYPSVKQSFSEMLLLVKMVDEKM